MAEEHSRDNAIGKEDNQGAKVVSLKTDMVRFDPNDMVSGQKLHIYIETQTELDGKREKLYIYATTCDVETVGPNGKRCGPDHFLFAFRVGPESEYDNGHVTAVTADVFTEDGHHTVLRWKKGPRGAGAVLINWDEALSARSRCGHLALSFTIKMRKDCVRGFLDASSEVDDTFEGEPDIFEEQPIVECLKCPSLPALVRAEPRVAASLESGGRGTPFEDDGIPNFVQPAFFITVGDRRFKTHPGDLSSRSDYFKRVIEGGSSESKKDEVKEKDVEPDEMEAFLTILRDQNRILDYNKDLNMLLSLCRLCDKYGVGDLYRLCERGILAMDIPAECLVGLLDWAFLIESADVIKSVSYRVKEGRQTIVLVSVYQKAKEMSVMKRAKELHIPEVVRSCENVLNSMTSFRFDTAAFLSEAFELCTLAYENELAGLLTRCSMLMASIFREESEQSQAQQWSRAALDFLYEHPGVFAALFRETRRIIAENVENEQNVE